MRVWAWRHEVRLGCGDHPRFCDDRRDYDLRRARGSDKLPVTPYYEEAGITIYHGDCRIILPQLPRSTLMLTDPPYGLGEDMWDTNAKTPKRRWRLHHEQMEWDGMAWWPTLANYFSMRISRSFGVGI